MTDSTHLKWIYDRMTDVHGENPNLDYMVKFKAIIDKLDSVFSESIESLDLRKRALSGLKSFGASTIGDVINISPSDLLKSKNCGAASIMEIKMALRFKGINWGGGK